MVVGGNSRLPLLPKIFFRKPQNKETKPSYTIVQICQNKYKQGAMSQTFIGSARDILMKCMKENVECFNKISG